MFKFLRADYKKNKTTMKYLKIICLKMRCSLQKNHVYGDGFNMAFQKKCHIILYKTTF